MTKRTMRRRRKRRRSERCWQELDLQGSCCSERPLGCCKFLSMQLQLLLM